ncbi:MAG TPA: DUF899 family protein [Pseudonocardia sp.]
MRRAEAELRVRIEAVAALRRALPPGVAVQNHRFVEGAADLAADGPERAVTLEELFGDHDELVIYHLMLHPEDNGACAACSMFVDGLNGVERHIAQRTAFVVMAPAPFPALRGWARVRGWSRVRLVSAAGTTFLDDLGVAGSRGALFPAFSVHVHDREAGGVRHVLTQPADFPDGTPRGTDLLTPVWNLFDLLPSGRGDREPGNAYPRARASGGVSAS